MDNLHGEPRQNTAGVKLPCVEMASHCSRFMKSCDMDTAELTFRHCCFCDNIGTDLFPYDSTTSCTSLRQSSSGMTAAFTAQTTFVRIPVTGIRTNLPCESKIADSDLPSHRVKQKFADNSTCW